MTKNKTRVRIIEGKFEGQYGYIKDAVNAICPESNDIFVIQLDNKTIYPFLCNQDCFEVIE
jgi:hypothetical protein